jgi:molybdopterin synthase catalytic subunit
VDAVRLAELRDAALSVDEVVAAVDEAGAGGTAVFVGRVRDSDGGRAVASLAYSAHPSAAEVLRAVAERVAAGRPEGDGTVLLAATHRVGELAVGDVAVVVAASAAHRSAAFDACRRLIDDLKHEVPIWKHQRFVDGTDEWVAAGG